MHENEVNQLVGHLFRQEAGKMAAVLTRLLGFDHFERAEDIVQDTLLKALSVWKIKGVPENPSAWLHTVAKRKALDTLREHKLHSTIHTEISHALKSEWTLVPAVKQMFLENEIEDSQLRMMFACCHPSIPYDSQLALTLKTLCGLSVAEIAQNFLTNEETITKRLYRAREKIREEKINLEAIDPSTLKPRLDAVLHAIYLLFNEGYNSSHSDHLIRDELCEEAMRLCLLLTRNSLTNLPVTKALLALMCFQASRSESRLDGDGNIILLQHQDRSKWDQRLIDRGKFYLEKASEEEDISEYHLEAVIAGCHANAPSFKETDWSTILVVYNLLCNLKPGPITELNRAIAVGYADSRARGIEALKEVKGLDSNYIYHAALGDFYRDLKNNGLAEKSYHQAIVLTSSSKEKQLLQKKLAQLKEDSSLSIS
jgi:RNA polymerase sigma factor (sigma-70 family)